MSSVNNTNIKYIKNNKKDVIQKGYDECDITKKNIPSVMSIFFSVRATSSVISGLATIWNKSMNKYQLKISNHIQHELKAKIDVIWRIMVRKDFILGFETTNSMKHEGL